MRANEIVNEAGVGKIKHLDQPLQGFGGGGAGGGGAGGAFSSFGTVGAKRAAGQGQTPPVAPAAPDAATAAAKSAEATRVARQAQATQAVQSQMVPKPAAVPEPAVTKGNPPVFRRPEGRTAGGFDPSKPPYSGPAPRRPETELDKALKVKPPPQYTQTPSDAARAADARKTLGARVAGATLGGTVAGIGAGAYLGSKEQPATGTSTATPPPNDAWQVQPAPGQAAASKAAADELKKAPPRDRTQIDELGPLVIPALAGLGAAGLAGTAAYQASKPSKPTSAQPSSTAARPAATTPAATPRPAAATTPASATTPRPAAATSKPSGGPQQGVVGSELARLSGGDFASRADRLNQARVDAVLGPGYKAGSAAANLALRNYYKANPPMSDAQRQELAREIFNRTMERHRQQGDGVATVRPAGSSSSSSSLTDPIEPLQRIEIPAPGSRSSGGPSSASPAASSSGGPSSASPAASSSGDSSDNTVKSGTGLTWTDSSGNPIKYGVDETALQRLMKLSGQRH